MQPIKSSQVQTESEQKDSGAQVQTESKQKDSETKRRENIEKMKKQYPDFFVQVFICRYTKLCTPTNNPCIGS